MRKKSTVLKVILPAVNSHLRFQNLQFRWSAPEYCSHLQMVLPFWYSQYAARNTPASSSGSEIPISFSTSCFPYRPIWYSLLYRSLISCSIKLGNGSCFFCRSTVKEMWFASANTNYRDSAYMQAPFPHISYLFHQFKNARLNMPENLFVFLEKPIPYLVYLSIFLTSTVSPGFFWNWIPEPIRIISFLFATVATLLLMTLVISCFIPIR